MTYAQNQAKTNRIQLSIIKNYTCLEFDAPDLYTAAFIRAAVNHRNNRKVNTTNALIAIATQAAEARNKCMDMIADIPAYSHVYRTNKKRYALSQRRLSYASSSRDPSILNEEHITEEDLSVTCFLPSHELACFISKATTGTFSDDISADAHHNNVIFSEQRECLVRDENGYLPLTVAMKDAGQLTLRLYASAFETQLAICNAHMEAATRIAGA